MKNKQQKAQMVLITIGLLLILITYFYYPYIKQAEFIKKQPSQKEFEKETNNEETTFFESVEYKGLYNLNQPFTIRSEKAYILNKEPDIVYMNNMHVVLYLTDGRIVNIVSKKGKYNKKTYDCFFEEDVKATDGETNIAAENLDLFATKNTVEIYNNVNLDYPTSSLLADKIDYDFEKKYFKISMFDDATIKMKVIK